MIVRRATRQDAPRLAALLREAFDEHAPRYTGAAFEATCPPAAALASRLDEGPTWIAVGDTGSAIGTVSARKDDEGVYLRSMAVHPDARGHGVGKRLLAEVERFARALGSNRIHLCTTPFLGDAIRLYERAGFVRAPHADGDLHGTPLLTMEKHLR